MGNKNINIFLNKVIKKKDQLRSTFGTLSAPIIKNPD